MGKFLENYIKLHFKPDIEYNKQLTFKQFSESYTSNELYTYGIELDFNALENSLTLQIPAHLRLTIQQKFRTWLALKDTPFNWEDLVIYTWRGLKTILPIAIFNIDNGKVYYCPDLDGNAELIFTLGKPYAKLI